MKGLQELFERIGQVATRAILALHPDCSRIITDLPPESVSETEFAMHCAGLIQRHGLLDIALLKLLSDRHSGERSCIASIALEHRLPIELIFSPSPVLNASARTLTRRDLPKLLAETELEPKSVLALADENTSLVAGNSRLDQWVNICVPLSSNLPATATSVLAITDVVQTLRFTSELSRWTAAFCESILTEFSGPSTPGGGKKTVKNTVLEFVEREISRWETIRRRAEPCDLEMKQFIQQWLSAWVNVSHALKSACGRHRPSDAESGAPSQDQPRGLAASDC